MANQSGARARWLNYCDHVINQFEVYETAFSDFLRSPGEHVYQDPGQNCHKHFACIMGQHRCHRDKITAMLQDNDLIEHNILIYHRNHTPIMPGTVPAPSTVIEIVRTEPWSRINENWSNRSRWRSCLESFACASVPAYSMPDAFHAPYYPQVFFDLVAETVYDYPGVFLSEKTFRPIAGARPFVLVAAAGTLAHLHDLGFKTFNQWWDESYDQIQDPDDRFEKISQVIKDICSWSMPRCRRTLEDMKKVFDHNRQTYLAHIQ